MIYFIYFSPLSLKKKKKKKKQILKNKQNETAAAATTRKKEKLALSRVIYPVASLIYDGRKWAVQKPSVASCITLDFSFDIWRGKYIVCYV